MALNGHIKNNLQNTNKNNSTLKNQQFKSTNNKMGNDTKVSNNEMAKIKEILPDLLKRNEKKNSNIISLNNNINQNNNVEVGKAKLDDKEELIGSEKQPVNSIENDTGRNDSKQENSNKNPHGNSKVSVATTGYSVSRTSGSVIDLAPDIQQVNTNLLQETEEIESPEKALQSSNADQYIKSAIPYLPLPVAITLLLLNVVLPGVGTIISGFSVLCCGKPRVQTKDGHTAITCCVNLWVGVAQLFTVPFMLVGWFWSLVWGIYMVILAVEERNQKQLHKKKQLQATAVAAMGGKVRPWMLKT